MSIAEPLVYSLHIHRWLIMPLVFLIHLQFSTQQGVYQTYGFRPLLVLLPDALIIGAHAPPCTLSMISKAGWFCRDVPAVFNCRIA